MQAQEVSVDQLRNQTQKIHLVMEMAKVAYEKETLTAMIEQHREDIDYNFLMLITMTIQQGAQTHDEPLVDRYGRLREQIVTQLDLKADEVPSLGVEDQVDDLIDMLLNTPPLMLQGAVGANRPLIDYNFFMQLTQRAEQSADPEEQKQLLALHSTLIEMTEQMDRMAQEAMERASYQLQEVLQAEDIEAKLQELFQELDEAFLVVLSANVEEANTQGRKEIANLLMHIYRRVVEMMESRLRPELRAMNDLLRMESSEQRRARLRQELQIYNPAGFIEMIEAIGGDLEDSGQANAPLLEQIYIIADEARDVLATMDHAFTPPTQSLFGRPDNVILTPQEEQRRQQANMPGILLP